jgi:RHS repeat-associated protein
MSYDANVNMIKDLDRDIVTIKYNLLNLPDLIQFKNGCQIKHTYAADGQKLSSRYVTVNAGVYQPLNPGQVIENLDVNENDNVTVDGMDYIGNIEYQIYRYFDWDVTFEPAELKYIFRVHNPEGFAKNTTTTNGPIYSYYRKDHLGNNREVWRASYTWGSTTHPAATVQRTQYYPSGLPWKSNSGDNPGSQPYKYGGKEFVEMHGLDEYDSDARWYYPAIMRTTTMDPLAEKYYDISPYAWCGNNPVRFVDPDGRIIVDSNGVRIYKNGEWTGNNSYGARRIGEAMMNTPVGKELFNQLANSAIPVELILDQGVGDGSRNARTDNKYDEKSGTHTSSTITVFEGMAEKKLTELQGKKNDIDLGGTFSSGSETDKVRLENSMPTSVEEIIGQKAIHEAVHVLDKGSQRKHQPDKNKREELPIKKEIEAVKQTPLYRIKQQ